LAIERSDGILTRPFALGSVLILSVATTCFKKHSHIRLKIRFNKKIVLGSFVSICY
jgi:hypothetical protein